MTKLSDEEIIKKQKEWLEQIMRDHEIESFDTLAERTDIKKSEIESFDKANRFNNVKLLSDEVIRKLYDFSGNAPDFPSKLKEPSEGVTVNRVCLEYFESCRVKSNIPSKHAFCKKVGISEATISRLQNNITKKGLNHTNLKKLEKYSGLPIPKILLSVRKNSGLSIKIIGEIDFNKGDIVNLKNDLGNVQSPVGTTHSRDVAIKVISKGKASWLRDNCLIYVRRPKHGEIIKSCIGHTCYLKSKDGAPTIRVLGLTHNPKIYRLINVNDPSDYYESELEWAAPITWIKGLT